MLKPVSAKTLKMLSAKMLSAERYLGHNSDNEFGQQSETDFGPTHERVFCNKSETDVGKHPKAISDALLEQMMSSKFLKMVSA